MPMTSTMNKIPGFITLARTAASTINSLEEEPRAGLLREATLKIREESGKEVLQRLYNLANTRDECKKHLVYSNNKVSNPLVSMFSHFYAELPSSRLTGSPENTTRGQLRSALHNALQNGETEAEPIYKDERSIYHILQPIGQFMKHLHDANNRLYSQIESLFNKKLDEQGEDFRRLISEATSRYEEYSSILRDRAGQRSEHLDSFTKGVVYFLDGFKKFSWE
jgi:hypothetical protein